ncbi:hypothetical protein LI291_12820 [Intestinibacillus massiliensis]|nr:hypothetical protein [Intestinibacillus massiliensis]
MKRRKNRKDAALLGAMAALFALVLVFMHAGVQDAGRVADEEGLRIAEQSIRRAAVSCYAAEGRYPPSYAYIRTHYGVQVDEGRYAVHYEVFASNLMPDITVLERTGT